MVQFSWSSDLLLDFPSHGACPVVSDAVFWRNRTHRSAMYGKSWSRNEFWSGSGDRILPGRCARSWCFSASIANIDVSTRCFISQQLLRAMP
jgi:hypothetical protein